MMKRIVTGAAVLMMMVLAVRPNSWGQAQPAAKAAKAGSVESPPGSGGLEDFNPAGGKNDTGGKDEADELLSGDSGARNGDLKTFEIRTSDDISALEVGDLYKNEETAYKIVAIKRKSAKGGLFTAQRIAGQSDPQRRWNRLSGSGPMIIITRTTLLDLYVQGGPFLHPIALLFVVMVVLSVNGGLIYRRKEQCSPEFLAAAEGALRRGDLARFADLSKNAKGLMPFICRHMVRDFDVSEMSDIRSQVEVATRTHINRLRIPIRALNLIAVAAPLLGLLGTIVGMVLVFEGVAGTSGAAKASILAAGIRVKLFSTATALMVAIPALFIYFIFNQKLGVIVGECELIHERFMAILTRMKRAAGRRGDEVYPQEGAQDATPEPVAVASEIAGEPVVELVAEPVEASPETLAEPVVEGDPAPDAAGTPTERDRAE